ncbi:MAG: tRNA (adenosine(37)-N6)-dimethylallyltransferase MiaA, partial [Nitrospinaceae bacterium]
MIPLIILTGPTTSKKSQTAIALAKKLGGEIINADSMQVYKYFDIGTAKPTREERDGVPHHLIDILEPDEEFTAFDFKTRALLLAGDLRKQNKIPIIVGGTGLYLKVLTEDYDCAVQTSPEIKKSVQAEIREQGVRAMHEQLRQIDPESAAQIKPTDPVRIERALSVYRQTGKKLSDFHQSDDPSCRDFSIHTFLIERKREELYADIDRRVDRMIEMGLVEEVRSILDRGYSKDLKPFQSIGYAQTVKHLEGTLTLDRAVCEIKRETRHYAKRQITWFKKVPDTLSVPADNSDTADTLKDKILSLLPQAAAFLLALIVCFGLHLPAEAKKSSAFQEGVLWYHQGDYQKSADRFQSLRESSSSDTEKKRSLYLLGRASAAQSEHKKAVEYFLQALTEYPEIEDYIRFELAHSFFAAGENAAALKQIETLTKIFPATLVLPQARLFEARVLRKENKIDQAVRSLEETIGKFSNEYRYDSFKDTIPELIHAQAELLSASGKPAEALVQYRKLYVHYPAHAVMEQASSEMERLQKLPEVSMEPLSFDEHGKRFSELLKDVRLERVVHEIRNLKNEHSLLPGKFYFYLASAQKGLRRRDPANQALREFLELYPHHAKVQEAWFSIGRNLWNLGRNREGIEHFQKVLKENPSSEWAVKSLFFTGRIYEEKRTTYPLALENYAAV